MNDANDRLYKMHSRPYRGVFFDGTRFYAKQSTHGSPKWMSDLFETDIEAALAYDAYIRETYGSNGLYNFPEPGEESVFCTGCDNCPGFTEAVA